MKRFTCFVFLLFSTFLVVAQQPEFSYGINGGPFFSRFKVDREYDFGYNIDYITGYNTALLFKMDLSSGVFVETQLGFCEQGYNENQESILEGLYYSFEDSYIGHEYEDRYLYLNNMWFVGYAYNLTDKFDISSSIGCYWGYLLGGESKYRSYYYLSADDAANIIENEPGMFLDISEGYHEYKKEESIEKSDYMDFDYGVCGRLSVIYRINSRMVVRASGGYRYGLRNIFKPNDGALMKYSRSISLTAGVLVAI